jgi:hypothetical protein
MIEFRDALHRRNQLVHHLYDDAQTREGDRRRDDMTAVVERFRRIALDCAELTVELQLFAVPRLQALLQVPVSRMAELIRSIDPVELADDGDRQRLGALQALGGLEGLVADLGGLKASGQWEPEASAAEAEIDSGLGESQRR